MIKFFALFILFVFYQFICCFKGYGQLNGINTINPGGSNFTADPGGVSGKNYTSFTNAVNALKSYGVDSAVTFDVTAGTYLEQINITTITGASTIQPVTFQSANLDSTSVVVKYSATSTLDNYVVKINNSHFINFRSVTFKATGSSYGIVVKIEANSDFCSFFNNSIQTSNINSSSMMSICTDATKNQYITITNNYISGGYYGIYLNSSSIYSSGNIIDGNTIKDFFYYGININYQDAIKISKNIIQDSSLSGSITAIYGSNCSKDIEISRNKLILSGTNSIYGLYLNNGIGTTTLRGKIANNFISIRSSMTSTIHYGIYMSYCSYQDLSFNSVNIYTTSTTSRNFYLIGGTAASINIRNNIFSNFGGGYAIYIGTQATLSVSNYNDLYTNGTYLGYWVTNISNLTSWRIASAKDANSVSINPGYYSQTDLHTNTLGLNNIGTQVIAITDDIDGDIRTLTPDIGADEFTPTYMDANISGFVAPLMPCPGSDSVFVKIKNIGITALTSVKLTWQVNGVTQGSVSYSLSPPLLQYQEIIVSPGAYSFSAGSSYNLKFWTSLPNWTTDQNTLNDTFTTKNIKTALGGIYTIGMVSSDYSDFNTAVNDLIQFGICSAVRFRIKAGSYNEKVNIPAIKGASATNNIIFESYNLDSTSVDLNYSSSDTTDNYVVCLNGSNNIHFRLMKIRATGNTFGRAVVLTNGANYNTFANNIIMSQQGISSVYLAGVYYDGINNENNNTIKYNIIQGGYYGIYLNGNLTSTLEYFNVILNNIITDFYYYGIFAYKQKSPLIEGNIVQNYSGTPVAYGIYSYSFSDSLKIIKNKIILNATNSNYGLFLKNCSSFSSASGRIFNNFISLSGISACTDYGIYQYLCYYIDFQFNSVNINTLLSGNGIAFYSFNSRYYTLKNNILANFGEGYSVYIDPLKAYSYADYSDYNDFYSNGLYIGHCDNANILNLNDWKMTTSMDKNSISADPFFISSTDLHVSSKMLDSAGIYFPLVKDDIDNDHRDSSKTDIGADEFSIYHLDCGIANYNVAMPLCSGAVNNVIVKLRNYGNDTIKTTKINWTINGIPMTPKYYSGILTGFKDTNIIIGTYTFTTGSMYNIKAWTDSINGNLDQNHKNDTLFQYGIQTALAGTYSIGPTGRDYSTFNSAINDLRTFGVCNPVTFVVDSGTYNEQIKIPPISGSSSINTITFKSASKDSTKVVIAYASSSNIDNYLVKLDGANYITFMKMTLKSTSTSSYGNVVVIQSGAHYNIFKNNVIQSIGAKKSNSTGVSFQKYSANNYNLIENNLILNGYYGISINGEYTEFGKGNIIRENFINGFCGYGIMSYYQDSIVINKNRIVTNYSVANDCYGISCCYTNNGSVIINNNIQINASSNISGLYIFYSNGTKTSQILIANNFINLSGNAAKTVYGIISYGCYYQNVYHNSINITCGNPIKSSAMYFSSPSSGVYGFINVENNIAVNTSGGYAIYIDVDAVTLGYINICDFNCFYVNDTNNMGHYGNKDVTDLTTWQIISGKDHNSQSSLPPFISNTDLHLTNYADLRIKNPLREVLSDIDGETRSPSFPVTGADENPCYLVNAGICGIISPGKASCDGILPVIATLYNFGTTTLDSVYIDYIRNGVIKKTITYHCSLLYFSHTSVLIYIDTFCSGINYKVIVKTRLPNGINDPYPRDDADSVTNFRLLSFPKIKSVTNDTICRGTQATLKVSSDNTPVFFWYDSITGGNLVSFDSVYTTNKLNLSHTYFVEGGTSGIPNNITTTKRISDAEMGSMFDVKATSSDIVIDSFSVLLNTIIGTPVPIELYYKKGSYSGYETNPLAWSFIGRDTVISNGNTKFSDVILGHIKIKKGDTAAFYITSNDPGLLINYSDGAHVYKDSNLEVSTGTKNLYKFDNYFVHGKTWDGMIYYSSGSLCRTSRVPVYAIVRPIPHVNLGNDTNLCEGKSIVLDAGAGLGFSYDWKYNSPTYTISNNQTIHIDSSGNFMVMVNDKCGNSDKDSVTITMKPSPNAKFSINDTAQCISGNNFTFTNLSTISNGKINSYFWDLGSKDTSFSKDVNYSYLSADSYLVKMKVFSDFNCTDSQSLTVMVFPHPVSSFSIDQDMQCLENNVFTFTNNSSIINGSITDNAWDIGDGTIKHNISCYHSYLTDDTFDVKLVTLSDHKCIDSIIKTVIVFPQPVASFSINDTSQCLIGNYFSYLNNSTLKSGMMNFYWSSGDGDTSILYNYVHSYSNSGKFDIKLIVLSKNGCTDTSLQVVRVKPNPVVYLGKDTTLMDNQKIILDGGIGFDSYIWSNGSKNQKINIDTTGIGLNSMLFWVVATEEGCHGSDSINISFIQHPELHDFSINIFPNPTQSALNIEITGLYINAEIAMCDIQGHVLSKMQIEPENGIFRTEIDISTFAIGIYLLKIFNENVVRVEKIIKN